MKDKAFSKRWATRFDFNQRVASVFGNMLERSVPQYVETQRQAIEIIISHFGFKNFRTVCDLGCSTGIFLKNLSSAIPEKSKKYFSFVGIDNSDEMLKIAKKKLRNIDIPVELHNLDLNYTFKFSKPVDIVTSFYTLQFVRPVERRPLMANICNGIKSGGILILAEKVVESDPILDELYIDCYYRFKLRNGYSVKEIENKRLALENVLIPYRVEENIRLLKDSGFKSVATFSRWYNFCNFIAIKE